jgi:hypothetical protein
MTLMLLSEAWGKMNHEKNQKQKSRDTVPLSVFLTMLDSRPGTGDVFTYMQSFLY